MPPPAGSPRDWSVFPRTNGWKVRDSLQPPRRSDTRHLRYDERSASRLLGGQDRIYSLLFQQDYNEPCRLRRARIAPDRVHIAGAFVECLSRRQSDLPATPDSLDERPFQYIYDGMCIVSMYVFHGSRRIYDADH